MNLENIIEKNDNFIKVENDNELLIDKMSQTLAEAFKGYSLFEYFLDNAYDQDKMKIFFKTMLNVGKGDYLCFTNGDDVSSVAIFAPPKMKNATLCDYLKCGGLSLVKTFGIRNSIKMLRFNSFAEKIKRKHMKDNCWYLYFLGVKPAMKGQKLARLILQPVLKYLDENNQDCYLETLNKKNINIYSHFGFKKVEQVKVPRTNLTLYALFRESKKVESEEFSENDSNKII